METDSYLAEYTLSELNDFDSTCRVEHFKRFDQRSSKYTCNVDLSYYQKFKSDARFDSFFKGNVAKQVYLNLNKY